MEIADPVRPWPDFMRKPRTLAALLGLTSGSMLVAVGTLLSPLVAGAVVLGGLVAGAAMYSPFVSVLLTAAVVPLERVGRFTNDNSAVTFSLMRVLGLLGLASLLLHAFLTRTRLRVPLPVLLYAAHVFVCCLTLTYTTDFLDGFKWCGTMVGNLLFLFFVINAVRFSRQVRWPVILWLATTLLVGLFTMYQWHSGTAVVQDDRFANSGFRTTDDRFSTVIIDYAEFDEIGAVKRVLGATSHPAVYALNVILTIPFYVFILVTTDSWWMRIFSIAGLLVGSYNVLLTNTRAAMLALVLSLLLTFCSRLVKYRFAIVVAAIAVCGVAAPFLPSALYQRVLSAKNYSVGRSAAIQIRFQYWRAGVDMFADHWLLGVGSGNQKELPRRLSNVRMPPNTSIHNEYLESLLETGIVGYPLIVSFIVVLFRRCLQVTRRARESGDRHLYLFGVSTVIAFVTVLVFGLQCDVFHFTLKGWWLLMGLVVGIHGMNPVTGPKEGQLQIAGPLPPLESADAQ